jgi:hypothetical protein
MVEGTLPMSFLRKFFRTAEGQDPATLRNVSSFETLADRDLEAHMGIRRYSSFLLTDAIRPSYDLRVLPQQGYRHDAYRDKEGGGKIPVLMAAISAENLFEVFLDLLDPLGGEVDVVLETSHRSDDAGHDDLYREAIDLPVLKSLLLDYEDLLLNDGCTGIAILNPALSLEVQFDEHKLLVVYGEDLEAFEETLERHGIACDEDIRFLTEAEHVHCSNEERLDEFETFKRRLGLETEAYY